MTEFKKYYIINERELFEDYSKIEEGDILRFNMPPFCSGEYVCYIYKDENGFYIDTSNKGYFKGCRGDASIISKDNKYFEDFKKLI